MIIRIYVTRYFVGYMTLLIRDSDIKAAEITPEEVIKAVESAYLQDGKGLAQDTPRHEVKVNGKKLPHIAPGTTGIQQGLAYLEDTNVLSIMHIFRFNKVKSLVKLIDPQTGNTLSMIMRGYSTEKTEEESYLNYRTGASCAVAAKFLAKDKIDKVAVIGTGRVGKTSLICLSKVRDFNLVSVHSGRRRDESFAVEMSELLGIDVFPADSISDAVKGADIIVTATFSTKPLIEAEWIEEGAFIGAMGADCPMKMEISPSVFLNADKIVVDSEKCLTIGELAHPISEGIIKTNKIHGRIGEVVAGLKLGRENEKEIIIFESDGTCIQSASVDYLIYSKVKKLGLGTELKEITNFFINI